MADKKYRIGVLGATGYIGTPYRDEIRECEDARIVALCARRRNLLEQAAREDGAELATDDWRQVVDHPDVNLVVVATPDALHHEAVMACAGRGKHVLCEKPVGVNLKEAREMLDAYQARPDLVHYVPFWTRFADVFVQAKQMVEQGVLGDVRGVIYRWHNPRPPSMPLTWRDDAALSAAGSICDVGSHAYDAVRWMLGQQATRVLAHADTITPAKADIGSVNLGEALSWGTEHQLADVKSRKGHTCDYASVAWEFEQGAVGVLVLSHATYFRKGIAPELELHGTNASLGIDRVNGTLTLVKPDQKAEIVSKITDKGFGNRFRKYVFPAVEAVNSKQAYVDYPSLKDGWMVQRFTDAVVESARQGAWMELDAFA